MNTVNFISIPGQIVPDQEILIFGEHRLNYAQLNELVGRMSSVFKQLGLKLDQRSNIACDSDYMTSVPGVFAAGDCRRGQSLVVWAIWEGREAARGVDKYLMGETFLPASPEL